MKVTIINQLLPNVRPFSPFALTDVLTEIASDTGQSFFHFWQLENTLILGMKDTRVTDLPAGLNAVHKKGYQTIVRNSGGLGVIADQGVLNISYIFQKNEQTNTTDDAYKYMHQLMQLAFPELAIEAYEITDSYCPGTFDLSVHGKKIAGIAQRRLKNGIAVMLYLSVCDDQTLRGEIVRTFYQKGLSEQFGLNGYPPVDPASMITISKLGEKDYSIQEVVTRFKQLVEVQMEVTNPFNWIQDNQLTTLFTKKEQNMIERNEKIKELLYDHSLQRPTTII